MYIVALDEINIVLEQRDTKEGRKRLMLEFRWNIQQVIDVNDILECKSTKWVWLHSSSQQTNGLINMTNYNMDKQLNGELHENQVALT